MKKYIIVAFLLATSFQINAQVFTNKEVGKKNQTLIDSIKSTEYPYALPIWGDKATKMGFDLPYSAGLGINYMWQESDLVIDNLKVGFNNGPMYELDNIVRFDKAIATSQSISLRPDVWVFPFLNIYGIVGRTDASTEVGFGVWLPDPVTNTETEVFSASSKVNFTATTVGFGMTPTIGVAGGFIALDMNCAWTDVPQLNKPAFSFVFGPRFGKSFKLNKPEQAITAWAGGFRVKLNSGTEGSLQMGEVLPIDEWNEKIQSGSAAVADKQQEVDAWWSSLTPQEQNNPVNQAKYENANQVLDRAGQFFGNAEIAVGNASNASVQYSMDKAPKDMWNFIIGSQFQYSKHWMIRAEVGFLSSRTQVMAGLQYRFGL
jgi:hypothetical protein